MQMQSFGAVDYMIPELDPNFLGATQEELLESVAKTLVDAFPLSPRDFANTLAPFSKADRQTITQSFLAQGGDPGIAALSVDILAAIDDRSRRPSGFTKGMKVAYGLLGTASMAASAYHGYKRNNSLGWALWWALWGGVFPVFVPVIAVAQGFGKAK